MAYRPVRPEAASAQPMALENFASGSERKSCGYQCQQEESSSSRGEAAEQSYNRVIHHFVGFAPGAHDEGIIEGDNGNDIDPLLLELGQVLDISGQVVDRAGGSKSSYHSESDFVMLVHFGDPNDCTGHGE